MYGRGGGGGGGGGGGDRGSFAALDDGECRSVCVPFEGGDFHGGAFVGKSYFECEGRSYGPLALFLSARGVAGGGHVLVGVCFAKVCTVPSVIGTFVSGLFDIATIVVFVRTVLFPPFLFYFYPCRLSSPAP